MFQPNDGLDAAIEREKDRLLHVAELLEQDSILYRVDPWGDECTNCFNTRKITRRFKGMATRIRRFWGTAVQPITDVQLAEMIMGNLQLLNWSGKGARRGLLCDPMRDVRVAQELERLRDFVRTWSGDGCLQTFEDRQRFRKAAGLLLTSLPPP